MPETNIMLYVNIPQLKKKKTPYLPCLAPRPMTQINLVYLAIGLLLTEIIIGSSTCKQVQALRK